MALSLGTILFIEDDHVLSFCYEKWARKLNFDSEVVTEGGEALMALGVIDPELIFIDLTMPGMGGEETIKRIRENDHETPIICASGHSAEKMRSTVYDIGANDYLEKPFTFDQFQAAILKSLKAKG